MSAAVHANQPLPGADLVRILAEPLTLLQHEVGLDAWLVTRREGTDLRVLAAAGRGPATGSVLPWEDTICARMLRGEGPRCAPRCDAVPAYATAPVRRRLRTGAYIGAPLHGPSSQAVGTLCGLAVGEQPDRLALALPLVEQLAALLGVVLDQYDAVQELGAVADLAERDPVTGLLDRRGWERAVAVEEARSDRSASPAGVIAIDLDGFKQVNDLRGHAAGDAHLRAAGRALLSACRPEDVVSRVGGDEFAVLAAGCDVARLRTLEQRVAARLLATGVRASVGAASRRPGEPLRQTWERADTAMYGAKRAAVVQPAEVVPGARDLRAGAAPPTLTLVPPTRTPSGAGRVARAPGRESAAATRRTLVVALHEAGGLAADELVELQLADVVEHPAGLLLRAPGPDRFPGRARRFGMGRRSGGECPVDAFEAWRDLLERSFLAHHGRRMQPTDRAAQPLFVALGSGGRPTGSRLSVDAAARILRAAGRQDHRSAVVED